MTFTIPGIIHRPDFYLNHEVSDIDFYLRFQVQRTNVSPIDTADLWDRLSLSIGPKSMGSTWRRWENLFPELLCLNKIRDDG
jgi:hypothetical protein